MLPLLWFDEGLDELGQDLIDVIGQAVLDPPVYKNYLLCVFLGKTYVSIGRGGREKIRWGSKNRTS